MSRTENTSSSLKRLKTQTDKQTERLNMGLINKVDMVCLSPVEYGV